MQTLLSTPPSTYVTYGSSSRQQPAGTERNERLRSNDMNFLGDARNPYYPYLLLLLCTE